MIHGFGQTIRLHVNEIVKCLNNHAWNKRTVDEKGTIDGEKKNCWQIRMTDGKHEC